MPSVTRARIESRLAPKVAERGRRALSPGDVVSIGPLAEGQYVELEVVLMMPFVLRCPTQHVAERLVAEGQGGGRLMRMDRLAARVTYNRQLAAVKTVVQSRSATPNSNPNARKGEAKGGKVNPSRHLATAILGRDIGMVGYA